MAAGVNGSGPRTAPSGALRDKFVRETEMLINTISAKNEEIAANESQIADARAMLHFLKTGEGTR